MFISRLMVNLLLLLTQCAWLILNTQLFGPSKRNVTFTNNMVILVSQVIFFCVELGVNDECSLSNGFLLLLFLLFFLLLLKKFQHCSCCYCFGDFSFSSQKSAKSVLVVTVFVVLLVFEEISTLLLLLLFLMLLLNKFQHYWKKFQRCCCCWINFNIVGSPITRKSRQKVSLTVLKIF